MGRTANVRANEQGTFNYERCVELDIAGQSTGHSSSNQRGIAGAISKALSG